MKPLVKEGGEAALARVRHPLGAAVVEERGRLDAAVAVVVVVMELVMVVPPPDCEPSSTVAQDAHLTVPCLKMGVVSY